MKTPSRIRSVPRALLVAGCALGIGGAGLAAPADTAAVSAVPVSTSASASAPAADAFLALLQQRGLMPPAATAATAGGERVELRQRVQRVRDQASELVLSAVRFIGVPYRRGGSSEAQGFDCSGFTRYVFEHTVGLVLPRRADEQARQAGLLQVMRDELRPGDLVFFNTMRRAFSHVGIYVGDGRFVHAPRSGAEVRIEDMQQAYWARRYDGARRAATADVAVDAAAPLPRP